MLYEVRCLKSTEDMILALAGQFKQLSGESPDNCLNCPESARIISSVDFIEGVLSHLIVKTISNPKFDILFISQFLEFILYI